MEEKEHLPCQPSQPRNNVHIELFQFKFSGNIQFYCMNYFDILIVKWKLKPG